MTLRATVTLRARIRRCFQRWPGGIGAVLLIASLGAAAAPALAAPGLCVGPVCGDGFTRPSAYPWQLRMRVQDQWGHRERLVVDCRDGAISPLLGPVERGYAAAVGRRACRQAPLLGLPEASSALSSAPPIP